MSETTSTFDHFQAEQIRRNLGMSRAQFLANNFRDMQVSLLYRYETGQSDPLVSEDETTIAYVQWLRENGYKEKPTE